MAQPMMVQAAPMQPMEVQNPNAPPQQQMAQVAMVYPQQGGMMMPPAQQPPPDLTMLKAGTVCACCCPCCCGPIVGGVLCLTNHNAPHPEQQQWAKYAGIAGVWALCVNVSSAFLKPQA